jgi:hypothetical protein
MIKVGKRINLSTGLVGFGKTIVNEYKVILQSGERIIETSYVCEEEGELSKGNRGSFVKGLGGETFSEYSTRPGRHSIRYGNGVFNQHFSKGYAVQI